MSSAKKLIYVLNYVHQHDSQHFVHVFSLLHALESLFGWEIALLSEKGGKGLQLIQGRQVYYLSQKGKASRILALLKILFRLRINGFRIIFVRITKPAALASSVLKKFLDMRVLYWQSGTNYDLDREKSFIGRILDDAVMTGIIYGVDRFVTGPETMLTYYHNIYKVPKEKLLLLYNDIDLKRFSPSIVPCQCDDDIKILFVHSLSPSKKATLYLPAIIHRLNTIATVNLRITLTMIGDGPERPQIEEQIKAAADYFQVKMLGSLPNADLPKYLSNATIFIMPSYREGMPRALMEAMAMGIPAVATDAGGTLDLVGPLQSNYVVSRDDPVAFADKLSELAMNREMQQLVAMENLEFIKRFDTEIIANMYDKALLPLL